MAHALRFGERRLNDRERVRRRILRQARPSGERAVAAEGQVVHVLDEAGAPESDWRAPATEPAAQSSGCVSLAAATRASTATPTSLTSRRNARTSETTTPDGSHRRASRPARRAAPRHVAVPVRRWRRADTPALRARTGRSALLVLPCRPRSSGEASAAAWALRQRAQKRTSALLVPTQASARGAVREIALLCVLTKAQLRVGACLLRTPRAPGSLGVRSRFLLPSNPRHSLLDP